MAVLLTVHRWVAVGLLVAFAVLAVGGLLLRLVGVRETPLPYRALQQWTENALLVQVVVGVVLLVAGRRIVGELAFLHYAYGALFPFVAVVGGRIAALRREDRPYVGMAWGAFFAMGLSSRALITGLQSTGRSITDLF